MPRGGRRPGSGRKPKSLALHKLEGTYQASRHAHRAASPTAAVLTMPRAAPAVDWQPSEAEWAELSPRARDWLTATLGLYVVNALEGRQVLEAAGCSRGVRCWRPSPGWGRRRRSRGSGGCSGRCGRACGFWRGEDGDEAGGA